MTESILLDERVRRLSLQAFADLRGVLTPISFDEWGFEVVRAFVVTAPAGAVRGGHAHRAGRQVLMRVSGTVDVLVRCGGAVETIRLDRACPALLIEPGVWSQQAYVSEGAALVVFADTIYDSDDYVSDLVGDVNDEVSLEAVGG